MFGHEFVRNAYLAGTPIALACGLTGWFVVLRAEVFAADALSHVAFVGAVAAALIGIDERLGLFAATLLCGAAIARLGREAGENDVTIGIAFSWILGIGVLLLALLATSPSGGSGITTANTLFGSIYSLSAGTSTLAAVIAVVVVVALLLVARPLLAATLNPEIALLRGVPVRPLAIGFMALLALITAESTQAVGALLLLGLIAAPGGAAHALVSNPYRGLALAGGLALISMWVGLALSYEISSLPPSSAIVAVAVLIYVAAGSARAVAGGGFAPTDLDWLGERTGRES
jgi:zinc/manganese transport system permease protein